MALILAMCVFSFSMSITPGPVNFICLTSGVRHGFKSTLPFVSGATIGFVALLTFIGLAMNLINESLPQLLTLLCYMGSVFIAYIGFKILTANPQLTIQTDTQDRPSFVDGFLLQWLNPKAWTACVAGAAAFNVSDSLQRLVLFLSVYFIICYIGVSAWALVGDKISHWLQHSQRMRMFNIAMGGLLIVIAIYLCL